VRVQNGEDVIGELLEFVDNRLERLCRWRARNARDDRLVLSMRAWPIDRDAGLDAGGDHFHDVTAQNGESLAKIARKARLFLDAARQPIELGRPRDNRREVEAVGDLDVAIG
jgi:hypothetical protein